MAPGEVKAHASCPGDDHALNTTVFPSLKQMQADVTGAVADLFHGDGSAGGFMTSGGTESILVAVKAAREWGLAEGGIAEPGIVLATSTHAASAKASYYLGLAEGSGIDIFSVPTS